MLEWLQTLNPSLPSANPVVPPLSPPSDVLPCHLGTSLIQLNQGH